LSLIAGVPSVPWKMPPNVPPIGVGSPQVPGLPLPPPSPQPSMMMWMPSASAVNTPWLRSAPVTLATNAIVPALLIVAELKNATGSSVPSSPSGSGCPCHATGVTPHAPELPWGARTTRGFGASGEKAGVERYSMPRSIVFAATTRGSDCAWAEHARPASASEIGSTRRTFMGSANLWKPRWRSVGAARAAVARRLLHRLALAGFVGDCRDAFPNLRFGFGRAFVPATAQKWQRSRCDPRHCPPNLAVPFPMDRAVARRCRRVFLYAGWSMRQYHHKERYG
jgi:hypothetical protein